MAHKFQQHRQEHKNKQKYMHDELVALQPHDISMTSTFAHL